MASSLDVIRQAQRITPPGMTSPGQYPNMPPAPPSSQRRLIGAHPPSHMVHQSRVVPTGVTGRHSWTGNTSANTNLLSNRFQRLNLRLSAPTPGEEELCRHWMKNSAKFCRRHNDQIRTTTIQNNSSIQQQQNDQQIVQGQTKQFERPRTVQVPPIYRHPDTSPPLPHRVQSAGPRRIVVNMTSPNENLTSSDSDRITSPAVSQRSSPGMRRIVKQTPIARRPSTSSYSRGGSRGNSPSSAGRRHDNSDVRSQPRPPSARPSEIRWRNRVLTPHSQQETRPGSGSKGVTSRRWSLNENMMSQQNETKDDDSAYSSSRDVTINIEKGNVIQKHKPGDVTGSPPRSANSNRVTSGRVHFSDEKDDVDIPHDVTGEGAKVKLSKQGVRSVFYYHSNTTSHDRVARDSRMISVDDNGPPFTRHNASNYGRLLPLRQQRPVTQPAMGTQHSKIALKRKSNDFQQRQTTGNNIAQRVLPQNLSNPTEPKSHVVEYHIGPKFYPISLGDYDVINKQRRSMANEQRRQGVTSHPSMRCDFQTVTPYMNPEVGQRVVEWLAAVEQNPEVYYGFETDLITA